ncbi:hypothetical protein NGRA_2638, partial [Nosema granulosis]
MNELKDLSFDMATVAKSISEFSGEEDVDVGVWLKEVRLMASLVEMSEDLIVKLISLKLRGKARTYLVSLSNLNLAVLTEGLKKRFASTKTTDETLERFLAT